MTDVLLATEARLPDGEPGGDLLVAAFAERGLSARWARWDDPEVDWSAAGVVAARSTWDYMHRLDDFLAWAAHVERWSHLLNGSRAFRWNVDKAYLVDLALSGLPVVPTRLLEDPADLPARAAFFPGRILVKPRVGAGGIGVVVLEPDPQPEDLVGLVGGDLGGGPWLVQPVVESVRTEGETSVFMLDGRPVAQARKRPAGAEVRVHEQFGGRTEAVTLSAEAATLAVDAVAAAEDLVRMEQPDAELTYARVDMLRLPSGRLAVSEVEVVEPGLYLDVLPELAGRFVKVVEYALAHSDTQRGI